MRLRTVQERAWWVCWILRESQGYRANETGFKQGDVTMTEMQELTEEYAGIKLIGRGTVTEKTMKERVKKRN